MLTWLPERYLWRLILPSGNSQLVHDLSDAFDAADVSDSRAKRDITFICIAFEHANTQTPYPLCRRSRVKPRCYLEYPARILGGSALPYIDRDRRDVALRIQV